MPRNGLQIAPSIRRAVENAVGTWSFSAHDFDADALLYAALIMLEHALTIPDLEKWRMSTGGCFLLLLFLFFHT